MDKNENRPPRPDFLNSAEEVLDRLSDPGSPGRKSKAEPGPRKIERQESVYAIGYTLVNHNKETVGKQRMAISLNVATHGVALKTSEPHEVGELLMLDIHIRGERTIHTLGEIIHCRELRDGTFEDGIKFLDVNETDYQLLLKIFP
ncbi:MAG: PilZ domain-containing protein [Planctomycetota bacterium]